MEVSARLSSKGQVTVPRTVREALSLAEGDRIVFRVQPSRADPGGRSRYTGTARLIPGSWPS